MNGFVVWLTGLSASGKTTIGTHVARELKTRGYLVDILDGDVVRTHLSKGLGFSKDDRDTNVLRIGWVASRLARAGAGVIVSAISPYEQARNAARGFIIAHAPCIEIHVATPIDVCVARDPKGLYKKALKGEIRNFTGVDDPYEEPSNPDLRLRTEVQSPEESAHAVLALLETLQVIVARTQGDRCLRR